ncbi:hypothetical protein PGT21_023430 [Puccinia graminis f. sp. tritici]|uniref:Uncharacterized protein n=1 Tax=Puccinia graminis f. sp. tritici TaxID=56615 RepID=A0A5B0PGN5_PUCGR|nr:hypothetical protein PGT21_023430 [Puccinia graminis f. sp. tritici]KAA1100777.1 hypothetical protein PGTUg99_026388 [Puccinia graminis f. sp. tritici]
MARDLTPEQEIPVMEGTTPSHPPPAVPIRQSARKKVPHNPLTAFSAISPLFQR